MDDKKLWESVLVELELALSKPNFNTWFTDTHIIKQEDGSIYLSVPNKSTARKPIENSCSFLSSHSNEFTQLIFKDLPSNFHYCSFRLKNLFYLVYC